jgi:hypothetical protein
MGSLVVGISAAGLPGAVAVGTQEPALKRLLRQAAHRLVQEWAVRFQCTRTLSVRHPKGADDLCGLLGLLQRGLGWRLSVGMRTALRAGLRLLDVHLRLAHLLLLPTRE